MKIVLDTNIFFASLFNIGGNNASIFLHGEDYGVEFVSSYFLLEEVEKHLKKQAIKKGYIPEKLMEYVSIFITRLKIYDRSAYIESYNNIEPKMKNINPKDSDFVALAHHLKVPLRTNDKKLKDNIDLIQIFDTGDLIKEMNYQL